MFVGLPQETTHLGQPTDRNSKLHINLIIYCDVDEETNWTPLPPSPNQKRIKLLMTSHKQVFTHDKSNIAYILVDSYMYSEWWYLTKQNIKTCIARIKVKFVEHYITHKWGNKCIIMPYQHVFLHHLKIVFVNYMKSFLVS